MPATDHPGYDFALRTAARQAWGDRRSSYSVYFDKRRHLIYVRASGDRPPDDATVICIAQYWDEKSVQLRFSGARSEWVNF